ncbi:MAG: glycosyltransferase [Chloroflexota bacterium]|nr:glycosyltransferase [Chloroflexota bacterium]
MATSGMAIGTSFPSDDGDRRHLREHVEDPEDIFDLALAGARFVLDLEAEHREQAPSDRSRDEIRATASALAARRSLRDRSPAWMAAASALVRAGDVTAIELESALAERGADESLAQVLLRQTRASEETVAVALSRATTSPIVRLTTDPLGGDPLPTPADALGPHDNVLVDELAARRIPLDLQARHDMILVAAWEHEGVLAMADPADDRAAREAEDASELHLVRLTAVTSEIRRAIERCRQPRSDVDVPPTGSPRDAAQITAIAGVPLALVVLAFLFVFRDALNLRHQFALAALAIGFFFFTYAFRYYVTTAAVIGVVLFGDRLRRQRVVSQIRASSLATLRSLPLDGSGSGADYRTLRGERLDEIGAIRSIEPDRIGAYKLPKERQPFISVHLAMYNEKAVVDRLLNACTSLDYEQYEVVVADDSTDPEAIALLRRWADHPRVKILHRQTRKGFKGGALQQALKRMDQRTEYVMIFDSDFIPPPDAVWHFLDYFGRLPGPNGENGHGYHQGDLTRTASGVPTNGDRLAAVQGYQWHMLNASENWITKGIRTEFSGSYVLERAAQELFGTMKMISGSVYMIRADVLRRLGWSTSITEDWELTIRLYLAGYKVLYTPYIQAPSECVSRIRQLIRQRMRWARGHTHNVKRYFFAVLRSRHMSWREKAEFLYYAPYYLQSILFLAGSASWVTGIFLLGQRLPEWSELLGWSLVVSNVVALPLMNLAGLVLEGSVRRDLPGIGSFVALSTLLAPFQGWAALRGLLEPVEGDWDRTPKSGRITESVGTFKLAKLLSWELPRPRKKPSSRVAHVVVTCIAGVIAAATLAVGALSMRAAASTGKVHDGELVLPFVVGTVLPLAAVGHAWFRLDRRIATCVLAAVVGLSANVVFLAGTIPASAYAGTSSTFMFASTSAYSSPRVDMTQGYTPSGAGSTYPSTPGNGWSNDWVTDTFPSTASMAAGTSTVNAYLANNVSTIAYRDVSTRTLNNGKNLAVRTPAATVAGDVLIASIAVNRNGSSFTVAPGWSTVRALTDNGTSISLGIYWKVASPGDAGGGGSYTWKTNQNRYWSGAIRAYSGVDTTTPVDVENIASASSTNSFPAPSLTTTYQNELLVTSFAANTGAVNAWTPPAAMSANERYDVESTTTYVSSSGDDLLETAAGATGQQTATTSRPSATGLAHMLALRPTPLTCSLTAQLFWDQGGTGSTLSSLGTGTLTSYSPSNVTQISTTFSTSGVTQFADGDRLDLQVSAPVDPANCNVQMSYDGTSLQSDLVTATIVPEAVAGLFLVAPVLPLAIRRRWIRFPWTRSGVAR